MFPDLAAALDHEHAQAALRQDFGGEALLFPQEAQKQVLRTYVLVAEPFRLFGGVGEYALALIGKWKVYGSRNLLPNGRMLFDLLANGLN